MRPSATVRCACRWRRRQSPFAGPSFTTRVTATDRSCPPPLDSTTASCGLIAARTNPFTRYSSVTADATVATRASDNGSPGLSASSGAMSLMATALAPATSSDARRCSGPRLTVKVSTISPSFSSRTYDASADRYPCCRRNASMLRLASSSRSRSTLRSWRIGTRESRRPFGQRIAGKHHPHPRAALDVHGEIDGCALRRQTSASISTRAS